MPVSEEMIRNTMTIMRMRNSELDFQRIPFDAENRLLNLISQGEFDKIHISPFDKFEGNLGLMAASAQTQYTYLTVSFIAVAARTAIQAGALADDVFDLSDVLLYTLSRLESIDDIHALYQLSATMLAKLVCEQSQKAPSLQVKQVQNYIGRNIFRKITLKDVAEYMEMSPNYICSLFSTQMGVSLHQYIQREKINAACSFLAHTNRSISDIALYMGFQTQSHFTVLFRKWQGMTPGEYRRRNYREVY